MKRLIASEFKKIFKSKIHIVLLLVLFIFNGVRTYQVYHDDKSYQNAVAYKDQDGNKIQGLQYWKLADQIHHSYVGKLDNMKLKQINTDFQNIMKKYPTSDIDTDKMIEVYGKNYEEKLENARNGMYTEDELSEFFSNYLELTGGMSFQQTPGSDRVIANFENYTKHQGQRNLYQAIYGVYSTNTTGGKEELYDAFTEDARQWMHINDMSKDKLYQFLSGYEIAPSSFLTSLDYYSVRIKENKPYMESNIGNNLFVTSLYNLEFLSLLILSIILSNIFAMEHHYKTDQIMAPTISGKRKVTQAKLITAILLSIGVVVAQFVLVFLMSCIFLPIRDLNLVYFSQSKSYINNVIEYVFTYRELIINGCLLITLSAIAISIVTSAVSYVTKNRFTTIIPLLLFILVTGYIPIFQTLLPNTYIDPFFPSQMIHFTQYFTNHASIDGSLPYFKLLGNTIAWKDVIMLFWILFIGIISYSLIVHSKKHIVKNH